MTEELRDKARTLGLDRLTEEHLAQFERGTTGMERHLQRLPRGMPAAREPRMSTERKGKRRERRARLSRSCRGRRTDPPKKLSPVEYVTALLARIEPVNTNGRYGCASCQAGTAVCDSSTAV